MSKSSKKIDYKQLVVDEAEVNGNEEETNATATLLPRNPHSAAERNKADGRRGIAVTDHGGGKKWKRMFRKKATPEQERNLGGEMPRLNGRDEANGEVSVP